MGFFRKPTQDIETWFSSLRDDYAELVHDISRFVSGQGAPTAGLVEAAKQAASGIAESAEQSARMLNAMSTQKVGATVQVRQFMDERGIQRGVQKPNRALAIAVITFCILVEGLLGAGLFFADGKADAALSLMYGLTIAGANVGLGVFNGFVFGRGLGHMMDAREPKLRFLLIRIGCWLAFLGFFAVMLGMHYAASRVQLTGDPNGIDSFVEHGPFASFANYYGILLMVVGIVGGIIAIREGWVGISDPIYGYSAICAQAEHELREAAEESHVRACEALELPYDDTADQLDGAIARLEADIADYHDTEADLKARVTRQNLEVPACMEAFRREAEEAHDRAQCLQGFLFQARPFDESRFEALIAEFPEDIPRQPLELEAKLSALREARQVLETAFQQGIAAIDQAYAAFLSGVTEYDTRRGPGT